MTRWIPPALAALLALGGCAEDLDPASLLTTSRVLAAKVHVTSDAADPTRTNPGPGETVEIELVVGDPAQELPRTWAFVACVPLATTFGPPICADFGSALGTFSQTELPDGPPYDPPRFEFTLPGAEALEDVSEVIAIGVICSGGTSDLAGVLAYFEALAEGNAQGRPPACEDPSHDGEIVVVQIPLLEGQVNHAPVIGVIGKEGPPFDYVAPPSATDRGCVADAAVPRVATDVDEILLTVSPPPSSRETYTTTGDADAEPVSHTESLEIAYFATAGEMERSFGFIDPDEALNDSVTWSPPKASEVPPEGLLVRFHFVMRDRRGGADATTRALCVVPAP
jgi:hypothetical protein